MGHHITAILGGVDPEMERIEALFSGAGITIIHASINGRRVTPGRAYEADSVAVSTDTRRVLLVECSPKWIWVGAPGGASFMDAEVPVDHHRPGDPGYGRPPSEFLSASSLGQTIAELARVGLIPGEWKHSPWAIPGEPGGFVAPYSCPGHGDKSWRVYASSDRVAVIPSDLVLAAASDHCPAAAYRGACPGVGPVVLMYWRAHTRAAFQRRPVEELLDDIKTSRQAIEGAPTIIIGGVQVADLRPGTVPELPEAALQIGAVVIASITTKDGRRHVVIQGAGEGSLAGRAPIDAFLGGWAAENGIIGIYGDPVRGYAGGYLPA